MQNLMSKQNVQSNNVHYNLCNRVKEQLLPQLSAYTHVSTYKSCTFLPTDLGILFLQIC